MGNICRRSNTLFVLSSSLIFFHFTPLCARSMSHEPGSANHSTRETVYLSISARNSELENCLTDSECNADEYCQKYAPGNGRRADTISDEKRLGVCKRRGTDGALCDSDGRIKCRKDLRCVKQKSERSVCIPRGRKGSKCNVEVTGECIPGLLCSIETDRCVDDIVTWIGRPCYFNPGRFWEGYECRTGLGIYCKEDAGESPDTGTCQLKKISGECESDSECHGFCPTSNIHPSQKSFCVPSRHIGQRCSENGQCVTGVCNYSGNDNLLHRYGTCVLQKHLIKIAGRRCDPKLDLCDMRRNLFCRSRNDKYVCVQQHGPHCTPRSEYSSCPKGFICRRNTEIYSKRPYGAYYCLVPQVVLKRGEICSLDESGLCEEGTECGKVVGVKGDPDFGYCVKRVGLGRDCRQQFRTSCNTGLHCLDGKCRDESSGKGKHRERKSYSKLYDACSAKKVCLPGLVCRKRECRLPTSTVKPNMSCRDTPTHETICDKHSFCDEPTVGLKICRKRDNNGRIEGARCSSKYPCRKGLKCSKKLTHQDNSTERICYKVSRALRQGEKCSRDESGKPPSARYPQTVAPVPECYIPKQKGDRATKCLPKGKQLVCQIEAKLFEYCSKQMNIACEKGLTCGKLSFCE